MPVAAKPSIAAEVEAQEIQVATRVAEFLNYLEVRLRRNYEDHPAHQRQKQMNTPAPRKRQTRAAFQHVRGGGA
jgi:hypothetical protein